MPHKVNALVLAGAPNDGKLHEISDASYEALVDINGKTILEYVLSGVMQSDKIGKVVVVGPNEVLDIVKKISSEDRIEIIPCGKDVAENVLTGIAHLPQDEYAVIFTSDIPFITGKDIDAFIEESFLNEAQVYYPIVSQEKIESSFPGAKRTYFSLQEGKFTAGNIFMVDAGIVMENEGLIKKVFNLRKNPLGIASLLGLGIILKFLAKKLSVKDIEARVLNTFGISGKGIVTECVSIGMDVDKPEDYIIASKML